jgi:hypothetical protein
MAELRRHRRLAWGVAFAVTALISVAVGSRALGDPDHPVDPCKAPGAAPPSQRALMPTGLTFDRIGTVTRVRRAEPYVMVRAISTKPLDELTVLIQDAVTAAGYRPAGMDNEGFEAEVFFNAGSFAGGQARVRQGVCRSRWDIDLVLLDRTAQRSSTG